MIEQQFHPVLMFSFIGERLHQQWVNANGEVQWRVVPVQQATAERAPCVTGYVAAEEGESDD